MNAPPIARNPNPVHGPGRDLHRVTRWVKFRAAILNRNPMCAVLENGQACRYPAIILHHIISPVVRPDLQLVASNVVPTCRQHHPNCPGTPWWKPGVHYTPTLGIEPNFYQVEER
jgi:hypothetical protein